MRSISLICCKVTSTSKSLSPLSNGMVAILPCEMSPFLYDSEIYQLGVRLLGADKILFGSDYPLLPPARYFGEIREAGLTKTQIDKICGRNAEQLLMSANEIK